jgi:autotransporter-associated beta strand protein
MGTLSGPGGTIDNLTAGGTPTLTIGALNANTTWGGVITNSSGIVTLINSGFGVITFTNTNTYTGPTILSAGQILADVTNAISPNSAITNQNITDGPMLGPGVTISSTWNIGANNTSELMDVPVGNAVYAGNINLVNAGGNQYRMGISGTGSLTLTGNTSYTTNNLFFDTRGNITYAGNANINIPAATFGLGRSTGHGIQVMLENDASLTAAAVSSGEGVSMTFMNLYMEGNANMQISGGYDMEDSTNTSSSTTIQLDSGTLGAGYFFQTKNPQGVNPILSGGPNGAVNATYMYLNGGVLEQTAQVGTNSFLPSINNLDIYDYAGGALFDSNGLKQIVQTPINDTEGAFLGDGGLQKLGLGTLVLSGINHNLFFEYMVRPTPSYPLISARPLSKAASSNCKTHGLLAAPTRATAMAISTTSPQCKPQTSRPTVSPPASPSTPVPQPASKAAPSPAATTAAISSALSKKTTPAEPLRSISADSPWIPRTPPSISTTPAPSPALSTCPIPASSK